MTDDNGGPFGRIYTLAEAAAKLRSTPRRVAKIARRDGLCSLSGRDMLFNEADISAVWAAMRGPQPATDGSASGHSKAYAKLLALVPPRTSKRTLKRKG